ncbi:MAG: ATP-binding protein, partial [Candidatus Hodarchaeales archaeon]
PLYEFVEERYQQSVKSYLTQVIEEKKPIYYYTEYLRPEKSLIHYESVASPIISDNKVIGLTVSSRDVTERKRIEEELKKRSYDLEERIKELTGLYEFSKFSVEPNRSLNEVIQKSIELIPNSYQFPEITSIRINYEEKLFHSSNFHETSWVQTTPIKISGETVGKIEVFYLEEKPPSDEGPFLKEERDLLDTFGRELGKFAERKIAETSLQISEERLRSTLDSIDDLVFTLDKSGFFDEYYQPQRKPDLLLPIEEFVGKSYKEVLPDNVKVKLEDAINSIKEYNKGIQFDYPLKMNNQEFWYNARLSSRKTISGEFEGITVVARDITQRKKAETTVNFLHTVLRHDLGNKLHVIEGYLTLINRLNLSEKEYEFISIALDACREGRALIAKIDTLKDMDRELLEETKQIELIPVMMSVIKEHKNQSAKEGFKIDFNIDNSKYNILGGSLLREVFSNVLENSLNHSNGSLIKITIQEVDKEIEIIIEDNGKGIPEQLKEDIFKRGIKGKTSKGSGIGLYIVKTIIEAYGGTICVDNAPQGGTQFIITLQKSEN